MTQALTLAQAAVGALVERFERNLEQHRRSEYSEANVRNEFIEPFFEALGWDVHNRFGASELNKDVVHEESVRVGSGIKAPDYTFKVGPSRAFFVEAKKPSVSIQSDLGPAYQLRRYAWSAHLPLSILTDFQEFAVYDCTRCPKPDDKAAVGRLSYYTYEQYSEQLQAIWDLFAKESVLRGSMERPRTGRPAGSEVDDQFLKEMEGWRDVLARNLALRNPALSVHELNFAVQATIDRIVFLRVAEDRGIEEYGRLQALLNGANLYGRLQELYRQADQRYNAGLFDFKADALSLTLQLDDKVLKDILARLYYPDSPYEFSVLPVEILGQVYEQFLGKVIRLTAGHQAKVEEKPEVKKAGGVYYTPSYIVDYIVKHTVGELVEGKSPAEIAGGFPVSGYQLPVRKRASRAAGDLPPTTGNRKPATDNLPLRILDPACGSGSFLLGAYQYLLDHCLNWYSQHGPDKWAASRQPPIYRRGGGWRLTTAERKRILLTHIFGVDIDRQAVEVTKLSLLLKVLEGESQETLGQQLALWRERALPNLDRNIQCGNSLIGPDYWEGRLAIDEEQRRRVNAFDWQRAFPEAMGVGGFDVVIGNPPYLKEYVDHQPFHDLRGTRLAKYYQGKMDLWYIFGCWSIDLMKPHGLHSFIATNNWITNSGASVFRSKVLRETQLREFTDFGDFRVFESAGIQTMIYVLERTGAPHRGRVRCRRINDPRVSVDQVMRFLAGDTCEGFSSSSDVEVVGSGQGNVLTFVDESELQTVRHIEDAGQYRLRATDVAQGIVLPQDFVLAKHLPALRDQTIRVGDGIFVLSDPEMRALPLSRAEEDVMKPYYTTRELSRYFGRRENRLWLIYVDPQAAARITALPHLKAHLDRFGPVITSDNRPYGLHRARDQQFFLGRKIVSLRKTDRPHFTYTDFPCYVSQTFVVLKPKDIDLEYLTGILNSRLCHFWLDRKGKKQGDALQVDKEPLLGIPIRTIDLSDPADVARHDRMVALVERMLELHKRQAEARTPADRELYARQIEATDREIDALVYELYGLTEEETGVVEGAVNGPQTD